MNQNNMTEAVVTCLSAARDTALQAQNPQLCPVHVATAVVDDKQGLPFRVLTRAGCDVAALSSALQHVLGKLPSQDPPTTPSLSGTMLKVLNKAGDLQKKFGDSYLALDLLLLALFEDRDVGGAFETHKFSRQKCEETIKLIRGNRKVDSKGAENHFEALRKYAVNMVELAEMGKLDPVIGRDDEIRRVIRVLARRTKNNPVLIGEPGVGKTAIVEGLAQRILRGDIPAGLQCEIWSLDMGALVAGASYRGEFEERLKSVLKEVSESQTGVILFIDELHLVLGAGKSDGAMDAANLLKPMLARGELRCIGATTLDEYKKHIEKDPAFERRFQQVYVDQPSVLDTISILRGLKETYEVHHGVQVADAALISAAQLADRYITQRFLPDKVPAHCLPRMPRGCLPARPSPSLSRRAWWASVGALVRYGRAVGGGGRQAASGHTLHSSSPTTVVCHSTPPPRRPAHPSILMCPQANLHLHVSPPPQWMHPGVTRNTRGQGSGRGGEWGGLPNVSPPPLSHPLLKPRAVSKSLAFASVCAPSPSWPMAPRSCLRPLTSWTRPVPMCGCSWTPNRRSSTTWTGARCNWRWSARR